MPDFIEIFKKPNC